MEVRIVVEEFKRKGGQWRESIRERGISDEIIYVEGT